jgi:haloalkane dehalogenase
MRRPSFTEWSRCLWNQATAGSGHRGELHILLLFALPTRRRPSWCDFPSHDSHSFHTREWSVPGFVESVHLTQRAFGMGGPIPSRMWSVWVVCDPQLAVACVCLERQRRAPLISNHRRSLFPFESSGGRVHYIDEGERRPIVFCHGQPMGSFLYRHIVLGLRGRFRCVDVDYPGYGLSFRPDGYGYTPSEHAGVLGELVDHLELDDMIVVGQDWGGPTSMSMAAARADRVLGIVLGNTWFWKDVSLRIRVFSKFTSTGFMQRRILEKNWFVETGIPAGTTTKLSEQVMEHYRAVQPTPEMRVALPIAPREILASGDWLEDLEAQVKAKLASKPALLVWGMKDTGFRPGLLARMKDIFPDRVVVELPDAKALHTSRRPERDRRRHHRSVRLTIIRQATLF